MSAIIVSGGCSFAHGFGLKNRHRNYANILAEKYQTDLLDVSVSGASNENIAASTAFGINRALSYKKYNKIIAIVGWTEMERFEYWDKQILRLQSLYMNRDAHIISDRGDRINKMSNFVYENMWDPCFSYYKLIHSFNYIYNICKAHNVQLINLKNIDLVKVKMPSGRILNAAVRTQDYTEGVLSQEATNIFIKMCNNPSFLQLTETDTKYRIDPGRDDHPSELAHLMWAETIEKDNQEIFLSL